MVGVVRVDASFWTFSGTERRDQYDQEVTLREAGLPDAAARRI
jgi:hypothetical protein